MEKRPAEPLWRTTREAVYYLFPLGVVVVLHVFGFFFGGFPVSAFGWVDLAVSLAFGVALIIRKWYPITLMSLSLAVSCLYLGAAWAGIVDGRVMDVSDPFLTAAAPFFAYNVMVHKPRPGAFLVGVVTLIVAKPWQPTTENVLVAVMLVFIPALVGLYIGVNRNLVRALTDRAERAEREQHLLAEQARADERLRLAEEMHDVVSHRVSLMVLHAGAIGVTARDGATKTAAEGLRVAGCEALNELRELVGVLRRGELGQIGAGKGDKPTSIPDLTSLLQESRSVGVPVELVQDGLPTQTSPTVSRTVYRIVQESLTNIRKHAPGADTVVLVRYIGDRLRLTVSNSHATGKVDPVLSASGSGSGLLGLRQRVELVGGTLHAGPRSAGGFEVDAVLPAYVPAPESP